MNLVFVHLPSEVEEVAGLDHCIRYCSVAAHMRNSFHRSRTMDFVEDTIASELEVVELNCWRAELERVPHRVRWREGTKGSLADAVVDARSAVMSRIAARAIGRSEWVEVTLCAEVVDSLIPESDSGGRRGSKT